MLSRLLKLWLVGTIAWWLYNLYLNRDKLGTFKDRDWMKALDYGINNFFCEVKVVGTCRDISVPFWERSTVNETFALILTFAGLPLLVFFCCFIISWIFRSPRAK